VVGTGQDGLPELGIGDAEVVEDANGVLILVLLDAGGWPWLKDWSKNRTYQMSRPDYVPESHSECVNDILIA